MQSHPTDEAVTLASNNPEHPAPIPAGEHNASVPAPTKKRLRLETAPAVTSSSTPQLATSAVSKKKGVTSAAEAAEIAGKINGTDWDRLVDSLSEFRAAKDVELRNTNAEIELANKKLEIIAKEKELQIESGKAAALRKEAADAEKENTLVQNEVAMVRLAAEKEVEIARKAAAEAEHRKLEMELECKEKIRDLREKITEVAISLGIDIVDLEQLLNWGN